MIELTIKPKDKAELVMIKKVLKALNVKFEENDSVFENIKSGLKEVKFLKKKRAKNYSR